MTFLVRQIARTADGREIVRPTRIARAEIAVGRSAECEIHLADLAVEPRHAVIREKAPGRISLEAVSGLGFEIDGRGAMRADIDASKGAELRFGSHRITVGTGEDAVTLSVERVEALSDASEAKDQSTVFTLRGLLPGKRISAWGFAVLVLLAFLAWPIYTYATWKDVEERPERFHADETWSTGKLSLAHASLESDCQACHQQPFVAVKDESCIGCHADAHDHAAPDRIAGAKAPPDLGGRIRLAFMGQFNVPEGRCVECHTEHEGATRMPLTAQRFCTDCHAGLDDRLTDTAIGNASDFGTDHPEFRPAVLVRPGGRNPPTRRVSLDDKPTEDNGLKFPHALHLSATGGVARMAQTMRGEQDFGASLVCKDCHTPDPTRTRFQPVDMEQNCSMCHSLAFDTVGGTIRTLRHGEPAQVVADLRAFYRSTPPARPINLSGMARRVPGDTARTRTVSDYAAAARARPGRADEAIRQVFSKGGACFDCHSVVAPPRGSVDFRISPVSQPMRYMHKGWFDHAPHETEACETCHKAPTSNSATDLLLPGIATCRECHGGENAKADVPSTCALCHSYHADDGAPWLVRARTTRDKGRERRGVASAR